METPDSEKDEKKQMKISDLEERTGIPRETIHYYIRQGLLPAPFKKGLRLAYYDESYVGLIDLIKKLQEERYLPLSVIRSLFLEQKYDVQELEKAFLSDLFGKSAALKKHGIEKFIDDIKTRSVTREYVRSLAERGILPKEAGEEEHEPSELELKLSHLCMRGEKLGFTLDQMRGMTALIEQLSDLECTSLIEMLRHKETPKEFVAALKDRQAFSEEFLLYQRARLIQNAVQEFIRQAESTRLRGADDYFSVPSEAFRKRHKIDEQIQQLRAKADQEKDEKLYDRLGWALLFCGRHDDLLALDDRRRNDRYKLAVAYANALKGEVEMAVKWAERAVKRNASDPLFLALTAGTYMMAASRSEGFIESTLWVSKALELLEET
ncbi:MAG: MerR family transcriptional regulator, partial [Bdellovibrionota bacterium]